jgi:hypothetical protein
MNNSDSCKDSFSYEQIGAPSLIVRNPTVHSYRDDPMARMDARAFLMERAALIRVRTRWNYPVDHHVLRNEFPALPDDFVYPANLWGKVLNHDRKTAHALADVSFSTNGTIHDDNDEMDENGGVDWKVAHSQCWSLQQEARAQILLEQEETFRDNSQRSLQRKILRNYQQYDLSFQTDSNMTYDSLKYTFIYDEERRNADPAYAASFPTLRTFQAIINDDFRSHQPGRAPLDVRKRDKDAMYMADDPSAPNEYGNCLMVFQCTCTFCHSSTTAANWCLLYAAGELMNQICIEFLHFAADINHGMNTRAFDADLDLGDSLRQLKQCGASKFVARTTGSCILFSVSIPAGDGLECSGAATLQKIDCIDSRSFCRGVKSFRPIDVACHPKYGFSQWTDPNICVLCESDPQTQSTVMQVHVSGDLLQTRHDISNVQSISQIEFSSDHPKVLWSAARSYVRPSLQAGYLRYKYPRLGHGYSLYSIDLRSNQSVSNNIDVRSPGVFSRLQAKTAFLLWMFSDISMESECRKLFN